MNMKYTQLFYACLCAKFNGNYRTVKGAEYASKLKKMNEQELKAELFRLNPKHDYYFGLDIKDKCLTD